MTQQTSRTVIVAQKKGMGVALILSILFGPLGLLYASVLGGILLMILAVVGGFFTLGVGAIVAWVLSPIWAIFAVLGHNRKVDRMMA